MKYLGVLALIYCGYFVVHNSIEKPIPSSEEDCFFFQYFPLNETWHEQNARYATDSSILDHTDQFRVFRFRVPGAHCADVAKQIENGSFSYNSINQFK